MSRPTVKKGLEILASEGYIFSIPGKGNFVCNPNLHTYSLNLEETWSVSKKSNESRIVEVNITKPSYEVGFNLRIKENKNVVIIKRVFLNHGEVKAYDVKYFPYYRGRPIVEKEIHYATFPEIVAKKKSLFTLTKKLKIQAILATNEVSQILEVTVGAPILVLKQTLLDEKGSPIGWGQLYFNSEDYELEAFSTFD